MDSLWPWLAVAGAGALHGLNPVAGWAPAAAIASRHRDARRFWRALGSIAAGHLLSVGLLAVALALGVGAGRGWLLALAMGALIALLARHAHRRSVPAPVSMAPSPPTGAWRSRWPSLSPSASASASTSTSTSVWTSTTNVGLGLWSFIVSTAHGAGLMLLPALAPLCLGNTAGREITASGSLPLALAVVVVHAVSMLAVGGAMGLAAAHGAGKARHWLGAWRR